MTLRRFLPAATAALCLAAGAPTGEAATPKGALGAIAVSPDGATVAAAGDNHALYLLDPATLEVRQRIHLGSNPQELWYSADGKTLAVWTLDDEVRLLSTEDWSVTATLLDVRHVAHAAQADALVLLGSAKRANEAKTTALRVASLVDGSVALESTVQGELVGLATTADAGGFVLLTKGVKDESEAKAETPKDLKGLEKETFELRHDGNTAEILVLDARGVETARVKSWYSTTAELTGVHDGRQVHFLGYGNENLTVSLDGTIVALFQGPTSYNYGIGVAPDQTRVALGGLRDGSLVILADRSAVVFKLDEVRGWPEYYKGFAFAPDGSVYAGTTSYRLVHIGADGRLLAARPVF
jgi:hypothetical protein